MMMHKGHRSKMFLWMLEEFEYILFGLHADDQDGLMVLGHKLLLLMHSRCCRKRRGGRASFCPAVLSLDHLPACSRDTLEHAVHSSKDGVALECLAWAVYDNQLAPEKSLSLSGFESYGQVLQCLVAKAFKGIQMHCLVHTSVVFKLIERLKSVVIVLQKSLQTESSWIEEYPMTRDVREEFAGGDHVAGREKPLDLDADMLKWMKEHQCSYTDAQLDFWLLLRPLTDGGEDWSRHLVHRLLSLWHWASALDLPVCPPALSSLNVGYWLCDDCMEDDRQQ